MSTKTSKSTLPMIRLSLILALSLAIASLVMAIVIPDLRARKNAVGSLSGLSPELQRTFTAEDDFAPLPKPGFSDWLANHKEPGQTYQQFINSRPNMPGAGGRNIIYLQPLGKFPDSAPKIETLHKYMEAYFHPMKVKVAPSLEIANSVLVKSRKNAGRLQWNCLDILNLLQKRVPRDAYIVMGITMTDLYPSEDWNFVFGMARIKNRVGAFSFARYGDDPTLALKRAMKVISHETGHAFGIRHCIHFHCLMNGSNHLNETDRAPLHFCPACLRKIHRGLKFDPVVRYQKLAAFLKEHKMAGEAEWFEKRIKKINKP